MTSRSPKSITGLRYRLSPHHGQERVLVQACGANRWLWNWALRYREDVWLAAKSAGATGLAGSVGYNHLSSLLVGLKEQYPWLKLAPHHTLQATLRDLDQAFAAFFAGRAGFPEYRRKGVGGSIRFPDAKQVKLEGDSVFLPKLGWVRFRKSRSVDGKIRNITVGREGGHWTISFCVEGNYVLPNAGCAGIALDLGVERSVAMSSGEYVSFPVPSKRENQRLRRLQRIISRRVKGSARRRRAVERHAKMKRNLANRRKDAAHKLSTRLATTHALIVIEDLKIKQMTAAVAGTVAEPGRNVRQKAGLNRSMLANAHADFRRMLAYKCERSGARLEAVNPAYTSQTCSQCHHCAPENRKSQAVFLCVACGHQQNADINAAINIMTAGLAATVRGGLEETPADEPRTHPSSGKRKLYGSTGIPVKALAA